MLTPFKNDYAFGLIVKNSHGQKLAAHSGGIDGFNAELAYYLQDKLSIVVLSNLSGPEASDMAHQLTLAAFNEPIISTKDRQAIEVPAEILKSYVGVYELAQRSWTRFGSPEAGSQPSFQASRSCRSSRNRLRNFSSERSTPSSNS